MVVLFGVGFVYVGLVGFGLARSVDGLGGVCGVLVWVGVVGGLVVLRESSFLSLVFFGWLWRTLVRLVDHSSFWLFGDDWMGLLFRLSFVLEGLGCDLFGVVGLMRNFWFAPVLVFCVGYFVWAGWVLVGLGLGFLWVWLL